MTAESSYKGCPTLSLNSDSKYPFTFGVAKAKAILANVDAIKAFVAKHEVKKTGSVNWDGSIRDPGEDSADRWEQSNGGRP